VFFRNRPYAPAKAFYFDLFADNGGDLRQIVFLDMARNHMAVADQPRGVGMAVMFGCSIVGAWAAALKRGI
jgi:hypothetical protein